MPKLPQRYCKQTKEKDVSPRAHTATCAAAGSRTSTWDGLRGAIPRVSVQSDSFYAICNIVPLHLVSLVPVVYGISQSMCLW